MLAAARHSAEAVSAAPFGKSIERVLGRPGLRVAATALIVCVAYYVGANIGFILRFPPATPSVLWPPNAILTATLLLAPPRRWWIYLLAALPAHLVAELWAAFPAGLALVLFATNCSEALVAAVLVRRFSNAPTRFDTLRRVAAFIGGAALVAPFVSSFADAAAVSLLRDESYWLVWRTRFFSNVLTELTLVPAIVMVVSAGVAWVRGASGRRRVEAAVLALALLVAGLVVFAGVEGANKIPGAPGMPLAFLLPFMLWAAVRFGPGGASLSLLSTALLAIWATTHERGPFSTTALADSVAALQIFLTIVAIPLMGLAALIEERRRAEAALAERLRFEELLARLSGAFVHVPSREVDETITSWLRRLGEFLELHRVMLLRLSDDERVLKVSHSWAVAGFEPGASVPRGVVGPWAIEQLLREQPFISSRRDDLLDEPSRGKDVRGQVSSRLTMPLAAGGRILGGLAFDSVGAERRWPDELVQRLQLVAEVFASALARREAEDALRASELMKSAILASLTSSVAVLDRDGRIIALNEGWKRVADENGGGNWDSTVVVGASYLEVCRQAARQGTRHASEALSGIEAVLDRSQPSFALEYGYRGERTERWFAMLVVPLTGPEGGAVVSHTDVTERRRAELEAQRSRQELAHFSRVSTMGELTASLAHELSQPLTGILTNAQAARRFLDATPPDLGELRSILLDIIEDDKRAGDVIQRLRDLLRKGELQRILLDLNVLIGDVARLLSSDAVIRNVTITLQLDPKPVLVSADRVQLQQVILNLLLNAMEAMGDGGPRSIVVRTENTEVDAAHVSVEDSGTGLREGTHEMIFEPFYTTKSAGMGMGLSIAKSIIEAHGGLIWALSNPIRGATFHFALPVAGGQRERN